MRDSTIRNYSTVVRDLIQTVGSEPGSYTARNLRAFVLERAQRHGPETAEWVAADIPLLSLDAFDCHRARLRVAGKGRREAWLPLSQDVGDAVLHYLRTGRPAKETSRVFLLSRPPFGPVEPHVVSQIARRGLHPGAPTPPTRPVA